MFRAVIVAAGLGRRLGADKALVELGDATIVERVVAAYRAARFDEVVVVRRAGAAALPSGLDARVVECEPPEMIDSVRAGLDGLPRERDSWAFVHPVDYALAADGVLVAMRAACVTRGVRIVTPECGGRRGHPIALHASLVDEVADPSVTTSLRDVLRRDEGRVATVDVTNPWIRRDIDEPDDLAAARAFLARPRGPTTNVMRAHRSRRRYAAHDVPDRQLEWLVDSARHAATSSLMQAYAVVAVRDAAQRERIAALCSDQAHVREAPVFLAVCADLHKIGVACDRHGGELQSGSLEVFLQAVIDAAIFAQNIQLAAESEGLGACMIGAARNHPVELAELLALPEHAFVAFGMTLGIPADDPIPRGRMPLGGVLHRETYDTDAAAEAVDGADDAMRTWARRTNAERGGFAGRKVNEQRGWTDRMARLWGTAAPPKGRAALAAALRQLGFGLGLGTADE